MCVCVCVCSHARGRTAYVHNVEWYEKLFRTGKTCREAVAAALCHHHRQCQNVPVKFRSVWMNSHNYSSLERMYAYIHIFLPMYVCMPNVVLVCIHIQAASEDCMCVYILNIPYTWIRMCSLLSEHRAHMSRALALWLKPNARRSQRALAWRKEAMFARVSALECECVFGAIAAAVHRVYHDCVCDRFSARQSEKGRAHPYSDCFGGRPCLGGAGGAGATGIRTRRRGCIVQGYV